MNQQTCNRAWLDAFLKDDLNEREEQMLTAHLDECSDCREELESRAAEQSVWQEASNMLGGSKLLSTAAIGDNRSAVHSPQISLVLQQLAPTDDPDSLGRIGGYEVTGVVGAGGMGVVLKAHDRSLDRMVAVKVMSPHLASNGSARKRFAREAKAAAAVLHPNVIAIHSVTSEEASPFLVMPFVRGASLQKRIDSQGPLPLKDTLRIGAQIAAGLAAAHAQGLVHRDIKPANILLEEGVERVTITDFGLARAIDDASMTCSGVIAGTPQYMSPEQARGEPIDASSDLFSLGGVLYAMCTGRSPFRAETTYGVLHRIANDKPTPVCEVNSDVPEWLGHVIGRLMDKRPEDRFESATQVAELLEGCLAHVQQPAAMPLPSSVEQLSQLLPVSASASQQAKKQLGQLFYNFPPIGKLSAAAVGLFGLLFAGILIVLELDRGTLTIESEMDDVPIRILQGDEIVKTLTVSREGVTTRIRAGQYVVEIGQGFDKAVVKDGSVKLSRGTMAVVSITQTEHTRENEKAKVETAQAWPSSLSQSKQDVSQVFANIDGKVSEVLVAHNSEVEKGQILLRLSNNELQMELSITSAHLKDSQAELDSITKKIHDNNDFTFDEVKEMERDRSELQKRVAALAEQVKRLNDLLVVKSTIEGRIVTKDVAQLLKNRPVSVGQVLLEIAGAPSRNTIEDAERASSASRDASARASAEFPPVKIVVHDEEGKPLEGVKVSLYQLAKSSGGQVLEINETSNASGMAVNRNLPYGHYELSARTSDGWSLGYGSRLNVEFEKGLNVVLVAPTASKMAKLVIGSDLGPPSAAINELRFGQLEKVNGQGYLGEYAPEPATKPMHEEVETEKQGSSSKRMSSFSGEGYGSFPSIASGIEYVGAEVDFEIKRSIPQSALSMQNVHTTWEWFPTENYKLKRRYLVANGQARILKDNKNLYLSPLDASQFFKLPSPSHRVGVSVLELGEPTALPLELDIPAGDVTVYIGRFYGKPNAATLAALNRRQPEKQTELWLEANILRESAWIERLMKTTDWVYSAPGENSYILSGHLLRRETLLKAGETLEVSLSPKPDHQKTSHKAPAIDHHP